MTVNNRLKFISMALLAFVALGSLNESFAGNARHFQQFLKTNECRGCDLSGIELDGDFTGADLFGANLSNTEIGNANFTNADLRNANLSYAKGDAINLTDADCDNANFLGSEIAKVTLDGADLGRADLSHVKWGSDADRSSMQGVKLLECNLAHADITHADIQGEFWKCNMELMKVSNSKVMLISDWTNRTGTNNCNFKGTNFTAITSYTDGNGKNFATLMGDLNYVIKKGAVAVGDVSFSGANTWDEALVADEGDD
jgi:uncharacterized protein YjbI with pentapeptide repeats